MEIIVLFTDTHFGVKNNSMTWLQSQLDFIYKQFIPELTKLKRTHPKDRVNLIHLGDVFDSRSTISTYVATKVREAFSELRSVVDEFDIIAGNHDYYSPNTDEVCSIDLLLEGLGINLHTKDSYITLDGDLYLPWYQYQDTEKVTRLVESGVAKRLFTHADIVSNIVPYKNVPIYSGHIHTPYIDKHKKLYNLGSCYSINFADANQQRGYYIITNDSYEFVPNTKSIRFYRLYNEEIFNTDISSLNCNDYIELYISETNMIKDKYIEEIKLYTEKFSHLWIIPKIEERNTSLENGFEIYNIESIIESVIPEDLKEYFNKVKNNITQ